MAAAQPSVLASWSPSPYESDEQSIGDALLALAQDFNASVIAPVTAPSLEAIASMSTETNVAAVLAAIRFAEGTSSANGYRYLFGSLPGREKLFDSFADHPRVRTYETHDNFIRNGKLDYTTAAGAYQITATTFDRLRKKLGTQGFTPAVQDAMAIELMREAGALTDARAGRFDAAVARLGGIWASLPSATYGQPTRTLTAMREAYRGAGGVFA